MTALWISGIANALLCIALVLAVRARVDAWNCADRRLHDERSNTEQARAAFDRLATEYGALAGAVSTSLEEIRRDVDRNYHHTHEGHVLDLIAYRLRCEIEVRRGVVREVPLDEYCADCVQATGGEISSHGTMSLGQLLDFGWRLHAMSRERSEQLACVVSQPCGNREHTGWMSKMLAIYELMCGRDKDLAIRRLSAVIEAWRFEPSHIAPSYIEDVR